MILFPRPTITIDEARDIIGPEADAYSDKEIEEMLELLYAIGRDLLDQHFGGDLQ